MSQSNIRILLSIILYITKTGQWKTIISVALYAIQAKLSYDEYIKRLDGSLYDEQVRRSAEAYKSKVKIYQDEVIVDIDVYDKWIKSQGKEEIK